MMERPAETLAAHHAWLRRVARRIARSPSSADDLVQDTCVTALQNAPEDAEMRPWLRSVMRKLAWGHSRSERRRARREELSCLYTPPSAEPDPLLAYGVDRRRLAEALETLPEPFRSTIVERYIEGRSCAEIAREEKVPAGTVRWRQTRALELLRSQLEGHERRGRPARRARIAWLLPALGIERAAAAVSRSLLALSGHTKVAGLVLAGVAVAIGLHLLDARAPDPQVRAGEALPAATSRRAPAGFSDAWSQVPPAERARLERLLAERRARAAAGASAHPTSFVPAGAAGPDQPPGRRGRSHGIDLDSDPAARLLEDCRVDDRGELRCHKSRTAPVPGRTSCDSLNRNLAFIDVTRSTRLMNISHADRFLTAAMVANLALATNLGCQLYSDAMDEQARGRGSGDGDTSCVTREGASGGLCTTCIDDTGEQTSMCAPADCYDELLPDGSLCTSCADPAGNSQTVCEDPAPADPGQCFSWLEGWRFICTSCENRPRSECLAAQCASDGAGCYTCVDEAGHSVTECPESLDCWGYNDYATTPGDGWASCHVSACPDGTSTRSCHYPGIDSCLISRVGNQMCIDCIYPGPFTRGVCVDPGEALPDPTREQPSTRPAPGACVTETSPGGYMSCTTCTNQDGDVDQQCSYAAGGACTTGKHPEDGSVCAICTYPDGATSGACTYAGI